MLIVTSRKGGTAKTTIATNLAASFAQEGRRTLLLDLDPQGDASAWLGIDDTGEALADALTGRGSLQDAIRPTEAEVDVAPAGEALDGIADSVAPGAVGDALASIRARYDAVLVDCPPALTGLVLSDYHATAEVRALVPVDGPQALRAVGRLRHAWEHAGLDPGRMRLVVTRYDRRRILDRGVDRQAREIYGTAVLGGAYSAPVSPDTGLGSD